MVPKGDHCQFCWNPFAGQHNVGCPKDEGTPEAMNKWQMGYEFGFGDSHLNWWQFDWLSPSYVLGYRAGKAEIDGLVDAAYDNSNQRVHEREY